MQTKTLIIAEAGVNHNGSLAMAKQLVDVAKTAGADIIKFQTFKAVKEISRYASKADYQEKNCSKNESQLEMVRRLELDNNSHFELRNYCFERQIEFLSTPFELESLEFLLNDMKLETIKISSGDITFAPLLLKTAQMGKKVILSTGMSTIGEIEEALGVLAYGYLGNANRPSIGMFKNAYLSDLGQKLLKEKVSLLHCTTEYPAPFEEINLKAMCTLRKAFGLPVGLSDHSEGIAVSIAAVAMGAKIIEKHFTLDKTLEGPDHKASLDPIELKTLVDGVRQVELAIGDFLKIPSKSEIKNKVIARKSLTANTKISEGDLFDEKNITFKRPGKGISPMLFWEYLGKKSNRSYEIDEEI